jgi:hypothetical protein
MDITNENEKDSKVESVLIGCSFKNSTYAVLIETITYDISVLHQSYNLRHHKDLIIERGGEEKGKINKFGVKH